jgi:hypothetical protein
MAGVANRSEAGQQVLKRVLGQRRARHGTLNRQRGPQGCGDLWKDHPSYRGLVAFPARLADAAYVTRATSYDFADPLGLDLVGKPRVYVASSVSEVLDALEQTERPENAADQLLRELSHS